MNKGLQEKFVDVNTRLGNICNIELTQSNTFQITISFIKEYSI